MQLKVLIYREIMGQRHMLNNIMDAIAKPRLKDILKAYPLFSLPNKVRGEINIFS